MLLVLLSSFLSTHYRSFSTHFRSLSKSAGGCASTATVSLFPPGKTFVKLYQIFPPRTLIPATLLPVSIPNPSLSTVYQPRSSRSRLIHWHPHHSFGRQYTITIGGQLSTMACHLEIQDCFLRCLYPFLLLLLIAPV